MRIAFTHNLQISGGEHEAEYDTPQTVAAITAALRELGHEVTPIEVSGPVSALVARLEALKPDLVLNTAEGSTGRFREAFFPALFERLGLPFTGSDAYTCALTLDKQLTKLVLSAHGVPMAEGRLVHSLREIDALTLRYPLICKPNYEGSSMGIGPDSVVENPSDLRARVRSLLDRYTAGVLIEEFVVGRDVVVPFVEGASPATFGVLEPAAYVIDPAYASKRKFAIYDLALKTSESDAVEVEVPAQIAKATRDEVLRLSRIVFEVLQVRDAARIDYRMRDDGSVVFLEINALPSLEPGAALYKSAALAGLTSVKSVLSTILASASRRFRIREGAPGGFALAHTLPNVSRAQLGLARKRRVGLIFNLRAPHAQPGQVDEATAEYDSPETIQALREAIESHGCEVVELEATPDLPLRLPLAGIDAAFNLAEGAEGRARESQVPALLEMLGIPYTGSDPTAIAVALDKALAKQVVAHAGIRTPAFVVMARGDEPLPAGFSFPAIAKPIFEGSSRGVTDKSVVHDEAELRALVVEQVARYRQPMIVEAFLPGREFTLGVLGPQAGASFPYIGAPGATPDLQPRVLLPMEVRFTSTTNPHPVYGFDNKFYSRDVALEVPAKVDPALGAELARIAAASFVALGCRDVARVDLRLDAEGRPCFIECNPLPGLAPGFSDLCVIATASGYSYEALIGDILKRALEAGTRPSQRPQAGRP